MEITYNKLWQLLIDRGMNEKELQKMAGLTDHTMLELHNDQDMSVYTILRICKFLGCEVTDIVDDVE